MLESFKMKSWSLKNRMIIVSSLVLIFAFSIIYLVTKSAYVNAGKVRIQESLTAQIYALMAVVEDHETDLIIPPLLRNDRLNHLNSGIVAFVIDNNENIVWRSQSSNNYKGVPKISNGHSLVNMVESELANELGKRGFFWVGDRIIWEFENGTESKFLFLIGENQSILKASVRQYKREVFLWLSITAIIIVLVLILAMNISLKPLNNAQKQIELIRYGDANSIKGVFPLELKPLTSSINRLLQNEADQKKRYRDSLGNLAHSLKTPLAVIKSELQHLPETPSKGELAKQIERINDIVRYQLNRSVVTAGQTLKRKTPIIAEVTKIVEALRKIHNNKNLMIEYEQNSECYFPGEIGDLMELVGNLADNACKWATSRVIIQVESNSKQLIIQVEDDGSGIPLEKRKLILDRGKRLDQQAEGQGLGLSIVLDIVKNYRGSIDIENSSLGGSLFRVEIPL